MQIKITRQEIGRIVGCSREMVGRVLKTLDEQGLVAVSGKTMETLDPASRLKITEFPRAGLQEVDLANFEHQTALVCYLKV